MKKRSLFLGAAAMVLTALFSACSSDDPVPGTGQEDPVDDGGKVYMNIDITSTTANGSRSTTTESGDNVSSDGIEAGTDAENKISNILVAIVGTKTENGKTVDNCFIAKWTKTFTSEQAIDQPKQITADFSRSAFLTHYSQHAGTADFDATKVRVYVICNYDDQIYGKVGTGGLNASYDWISAPEGTNKSKGVVTVDDILEYATANKILMTNYQIRDANIPTLEQINSNTYGTEATAYPLTQESNPILVERAVARFDYAHYVPSSELPSGYQANANAQLDTDHKDAYYVLTNATAVGAGDQPEIRLRIKQMALINRSKSFYLFKRVSDDGKPDGANFAICGREIDEGDGAGKRINYVVDPEWEIKSNVAQHKAQLPNMFKFYLGNRNTWVFKNISELTGGADLSSLGYKTWRYVTPNTIPGPNQQRAGISTGVVFRAQIEASDYTKGVGLAMANGYDILVYGGKILGSWSDVLKLTAETNTSRDLDLVAACNVAKTAEPSLAGNDWDADNDNKLNAAQITAVKAAMFSTYSKETNGTEGYFCDYYYWNRHNDNGNPSGMGPMEFGVVRNNVYKLAVTSIKRLGHPIDTSKDPDPVDPEDPDEESKLYMNVWVKVMPWVKRVNYIEF